MAELSDGTPVGVADIVAMARLAEDLGFDSIWTFDELVWRFEEREPLGF
jgi:alkanesulfonate monooxygenase SsuD/methylene tetrahydromethanopterin reductase-like flavin-dependent oxidoreductase (luciferase family)